MKMLIHHGVADKKLKGSSPAKQVNAYTLLNTGLQLIVYSEVGSSESI